MTPLTSYKSVSKPAILALGSPGTGKTTTICGSCPRPYVIEIDNNIAGTAKFLTDEKVDISEINLDIPHLNEDGTLVPRMDRWRMMTHRLKVAVERDNEASKMDFSKMKIQTIFVDSLTGLIEYALDEVRRQQGRKIGEDEKDITAKREKDKNDEPLQIQDWGCFGALLRHFFIKLRASQRIVVVSAHTFADKDDLAGFMKMFINCPGKFKEEIAGLFTECWKFSIEKKGDRYVRMLSTVPAVREEALGLKSSLRLGNTFEVDYSKIRTFLMS
jgi:hypothetical protein